MGNSGPGTGTDAPPKLRLSHRHRSGPGKAAHLHQPGRRAGVGGRGDADPKGAERDQPRIPTRRRRPAWYRHITLSMAAATFLTILRRDAQKGLRKPAAKS
ncbi:hypothetical protein FXW78_25440 [Rhodococcus opacus]|nr:hypothetical protein [Rhodococcus opacus]